MLNALRPIAVVAALVATFAAANNAKANNFPTHQVTLVVPFAPGAAVDVVARAMGTKLSEIWRVPVVVENKPGATTALAVRAVADAPADGHTLLFTTSYTFELVPFMAQFKTFQPSVTLAPINLLALLSNGIVAHPSLPVSNLKELVAYAKAHPNTLRYSSPGVGSNVHMSMEMLKSLAQIDIQHVPYRGVAPATTAVLANEVHLGMAGYSSRELVESGKLKMLSIAGRNRLPAFPKIPTTAEDGFGKVDSSTYLLLASSAKAPKELQERINKDIVQALNDPEIKRQLVDVHGLMIANIGLDAAAKELEQRAKAGSEMVRVSGADRE